MTRFAAARSEGGACTAITCHGQMEDHRHRYERTAKMTEQQPSRERFYGHICRCQWSCPNDQRTRMEEFWDIADRDPSVLFSFCLVLISITSHLLNARFIARTGVIEAHLLL